MSWQEFAPTNYNADPISGGVYADLVGSDPLATADGDASYVETYLVPSAPSATKTGTFRLTPSPSGSFTRVKVAAEYRRVTDSPTSFPNLIVWAWAAGRPDPVNVLTLPGVAGSYETHEAEIAFDLLPGSLSWFTPDVALASDTYWFIQNTAFTGSSIAVRTTWLRVYGYGGKRPLRWRQRSDGLGGGSPAAARGVRTQQGSIRHRGIL